MALLGVELRIRFRCYVQIIMEEKESYKVRGCQRTQ
jgi:hypothetical protein